MKKVILFLFVFTCINNLMNAQPSIQWQKSLGGTGSEGSYSIHQTNDGGYIAAGSSYSNDSDVTGNHGDGDYWVVKLTGVGIIQWQKSLGGTAYEAANSIQQTTDSGYIVAGYSYSNDGNVTGHHLNGDFWVVKLNSSGTIQWQKSLGGTGEDEANSIQQTTDGGYIVAGFSESNNGDVTGNHGSGDSWVVKLNTAGTIQWQKSLGGTGEDWAQSIQQTSDGGYIVAGGSNSNNGNVTGNHGDYDYWLVKLNNVGGIQWQKSLGGTTGDQASSIQQASDSGYIVAGFSNSNDGDVTGHHGTSSFLDCWVLKLNSAGTIQWQKSLGGTGDDWASSIQQTTDSGYIVAGMTQSGDGDVTGNHGLQDYWVIKLNSTGTIQWQKCLGGTSYDAAESILQTAAGDYIIAGSSSSTDGDVTGNHGGNDYWVVKLNSSLLGFEEIKAPFSNIQIIPNPISESSFISFSLLQSENITVTIYDITGRLVKNLFDGNLNPGEHHLKLDLTEGRAIDHGVYLLNFHGDGFSQSIKLVVIE